MLKEPGTADLTADVNYGVLQKVVSKLGKWEEVIVHGGKYGGGDGVGGRLITRHHVYRSGLPWAHEPEHVPSQDGH